MKKIHLLLFSVLVLAATSCKKDKADDTTIHLKCKIDGVEKTFNTSAAAGADTEDEQSAFAAFGASAASESAEHLFFYIVKPGSAVTAGTYTISGENYQITCLYQAGNGGFSYYGGSDVGTGETANPLRIVITQIDGKTVRGTFSGEIYQGGDDSSTKKTISEGSFYLNVTDQLPS